MDLFSLASSFKKRLASLALPIESPKQVFSDSNLESEIYGQICTDADQEQNQTTKVKNLKSKHLGKLSTSKPEDFKKGRIVTRSRFVKR